MENTGSPPVGTPIEPAQPGGGVTPAGQVAPAGQAIPSGVRGTPSGESDEPAGTEGAIGTSIVGSGIADLQGLAAPLVKEFRHGPDGEAGGDREEEELAERARRKPGRGVGEPAFGALGVGKLGGGDRGRLPRLELAVAGHHAPPRSRRANAPTVPQRWQRGTWATEKR